MRGPPSDSEARDRVAQRWLGARFWPGNPCIRGGFAAARGGASCARQQRVCEIVSPPVTARLPVLAHGLRRYSHGGSGWADPTPAALPWVAARGRTSLPEHLKDSAGRPYKGGVVGGTGNRRQLCANGGRPGAMASNSETDIADGASSVIALVPPIRTRYRHSAQHSVRKIQRALEIFLSGWVI